MAAISRLPIRYAAVVMGCAVTLAAAIWTLAFLAPMRTPFLLTTGGEVAVSSIALASVFTLLLMIESVAHERLFSDSFDPLAQRDSERLKINQRVLQNTLEQLPLFAAGIAMISWLYRWHFVRRSRRPPSGSYRAGYSGSAIISGHSTGSQV